MVEPIQVTQEGAGEDHCLAYSRSRRYDTCARQAGRPVELAIRANETDHNQVEAVIGFDSYVMERRITEDMDRHPTQAPAQT